MAVLSALNGCSFFRDVKPTEPTAGADSTATAKPVATTTTKKATPPVQKKAPDPAPVAAADSTKTVPATQPAPPGPTISVRMTPEERAERKQFFSSEALRALRSLEAIRNKPLTQLQQDQMASADRFLTEARAAVDSDLHRACTLVEKARIIAEELEKTVR